MLWTKQLKMLRANFQANIRRSKEKNKTAGRAIGRHGVHLFLTIYANQGTVVFLLFKKKWSESGLISALKDYSLIRNTKAMSNLHRSYATTFDR